MYILYVLLNLPPHFHQPVSDHSPPAAAQKRPSIIFIIWTTKVFKLVDCQRGMKMRGSKPDSNGSQKLLSKELLYHRIHY
ncbi:hypothetical protein F7725_008591 [Dissostichus mawsoni]|uniref:Uncharacterized protein n=1 Tax=Dissostichus mawsoni TaxID=36200 RepID=A0A7J5YAS6_DISMA|nr:hypothetical protein F7725_008591 [Dissostichus mawsoni]